MEEIYKLFEQFSISREFVSKTLNSCEDKYEAFNKFEGLKVFAQMSYYDMGMPIDIKDSLNRLNNIKLKNFTPPPPHIGALMSNRRSEIEQCP